MSPSRKVEEKREGFREMLERLDEMERHMAPGSEVSAEVRFSVRKEGENGYRTGVSPVTDNPIVDAGSDRAESATGDTPRQVDPVAFLHVALTRNPNKEGE